MTHRQPRTELGTHRVENQPPEVGDQDLWGDDPGLRRVVDREGPDWVGRFLAELGADLGREIWFEQGVLANRCPPELVSFDRHGRRLDEVRYHPSYHALMTRAIEGEVHRIAWTRQGEGGHLAHVAGLYQLTQPEQGVCCPVTMTHAAIPALRRAPGVAGIWEPRVLSARYDPRCLPAEEKHGVTVGMAMTEKQGGSDVRANATRAVADGEHWRLTGHKWFCSAPMSDAFLTLAQAPGGLTCFLVPRWQPDGTRNPFLIQRLKDKCGNRANASAEIEYRDTWAEAIGGEGEGVRTIIEMVQQTRLDAAVAPVGMLRQALVQALHHCRHRRAFGAPLLEQPLMRLVLADLALELEGGLAMVLRVAGAYDRAGDDEQARLFTRLATAVAKYWTNKRAPQAIAEAMECLGGGGYVEESILPRLYREAPLNGIWEGSGNVICLDVLRAMQRTPETVPAFLAEVEAGRGGHRHLDAALDRLRTALTDDSEPQRRARRITELMALTLQASLLVQHAPAAVADAFCASRLGGEAGLAFGTLAPETDTATILERAGVSP
ncbi:acyl-CoA dehydrogenase family protein [Spiribacter halobius]|uniref:DNA alkylation response protein n=1 Tax=Sediminicurvatus halobius TaxID=2182432 RepID=A0A2U2N040_9GAMM|nr:acyl-CoA dehydrogenase family protein [Spiribacter halobius]PWG62615.1 DNA alkylation response protein [Spiribacter halobius]UEX78466.1 acyl-CoA dehydrogenase family protein [Spiribacter halobius]